MGYGIYVWQRQLNGMGSDIFTELIRRVLRWHCVVSGRGDDSFQGDGWSEVEDKKDVEDDDEESVEDEDEGGVEDEEGMENEDGEDADKEDGRGSAS